VTHYRRSWGVVLLLAIGIAAGGALLSTLVLWAMNPRLFADLGDYGLYVDRTGELLACSAFAVLVTAVWWLRTPRVAHGRGFDATAHRSDSTGPAASHTRSPSGA
jgi:hypothetical protein